MKHGRNKDFESASERQVKNFDILPNASRACEKVLLQTLPSAVATNSVPDTTTTFRRIQSRESTTFLRNSTRTTNCHRRQKHNFPAPIPSLIQELSSKSLEDSSRFSPPPQRIRIIEKAARPYSFSSHTTNCTVQEGVT